jgi:chromosome segregation ATPase
MTSFDAAKARLDQALARLTDEIAATTARAVGRTDSVDRAAHDALARDYEILRAERDGLAARLQAAEQRIADLARNADELGRRLGGAIAKVERLMES